MQRQNLICQVRWELLLRIQTRFSKAESLPKGTKINLERIFKETSQKWPGFCINILEKNVLWGKNYLCLLYNYIEGYQPHRMVKFPLQISSLNMCSDLTPYIHKNALLIYKYFGSRNINVLLIHKSLFYQRNILNSAWNKYFKMCFNLTK